MIITFIRRLNSNSYTYVLMEMNKWIHLSSNEVTSELEVKVHAHLQMAISMVKDICNL